MIIIISVIGTKLQLSKNRVKSEWQIPEYLTDNAIFNYFNQHCDKQSRNVWQSTNLITVM